MAIWNPWHGCHKISEGCLNCYMFRRDAMYEKDSNRVTKTSTFSAPVKRGRDGRLYLIKRKDQIPQAHKANIDI